MSSKTFHGGVHPKEYKELTEHLAFELFPLPEQIVLPLSQHLGREAKALVKKGEDVKVGQMIAQAEGFVSAPVHTSVSGKVMSLGKEQTSSGFPKDLHLQELLDRAAQHFQHRLNFLPQRIKLLMW